MDIQAIECEPTFTASYEDLAAQMQDNETVKLMDGRIVDKIGVYLEELKNNPKDDKLYEQIREHIQKKEINRTSN